MCGVRLCVLGSSHGGNMGWLGLGFWFEVWWVEVGLCVVGVMYVYRMCVCGVRLCVLGSSHGGNVGWLGLGLWSCVWCFPKKTKKRSPKKLVSYCIVLYCI